MKTRILPFKTAIVASLLGLALAAQAGSSSTAGNSADVTIPVYYSNQTAVTYRGLFGTGAYTNSGYIALRTTRKAKFSARLELEGKRYSFTDAVTEGTCSRVLPRKGLSDLQVHLDFRQSGQVTGQISDGSWTSGLKAVHNNFNKKTNPTPLQGRYTMAIPFHSSSPSESPNGVGIGVVRVDSVGKVKFGGRLPDGTKLVQGSCLSDDGNWPFYTDLYGRKGCAMGWITVTNAYFDIEGSMAWHRPAKPGAKLYPNGFDSITDNVLGSSYYPPARGGAALNLTSLRFDIAYGNLPAIVSLSLSQDRNDHFVQTQGNNDYELQMTINRSSGLIKGSFIHPVTGKKTALLGALLQDLNEGAGYFLGADQTGTFEFGAYR